MQIARLRHLGIEIIMSNSMNLTDLIHDLTIPCADDGNKYTREDRPIRIRQLLEDRTYRLLGEAPLAMVWMHADFDYEKPVVLVSSHVDSLYEEYHCQFASGRFLGTFDNSITNAVVLELMLTGRLPVQVLVAFTGDEEEDSKGADQTIGILGNLTPPLHPAMVVVLDVTEEAYGEQAFTIENIFRMENNPDHFRPYFRRKKQLRDFVLGCLPGIVPHVVMDGEADESWQYDEHDLNCFSFCLPIKPVTDDMHDDDGVYADESAVIGYSQSLARLLDAMARAIRDAFS